MLNLFIHIAEANEERENKTLISRTNKHSIIFCLFILLLDMQVRGNKRTYTP